LHDLHRIRFHNSQVQIYIQGVIKLGGNILSRKPPRHLKTICTG
jgi:hypothetical protein